MANKQAIDALEKNAKQLALEAREWVASSEGQLALREMVHRAMEIMERLRKARLIDPKNLHEPVTL